MDKPVITLRTETEGQDLRLRKALSQKQSDGTFGELLDYMTNPRGDELNPDYNGDQRNLALRIQNWIIEMDSDPERSSVDLKYMKEDGTYSDSLSLKDRVQDYLPSISRKREAVDENGPFNYEEAELVVGYNTVGGNSERRFYFETAD